MHAHSAAKWNRENEKERKRETELNAEVVKVDRATSHKTRTRKESVAN
jgi:hypothetical protein